MARHFRNSMLENRTQRLKLAVARKPLFVRIGDGISLGYRRNKAGGTWVMRVADGKGGAKTAAIGLADDHADSDGEKILNFWQAQDRAKSSISGAITPGSGSLTVATAAENYLRTLEAKNARTAADTRGRLKKHFFPKFETKTVRSLTKTTIENWQSSLVAKSDDPETVRRSKDSANRVLTMVKALLNHAVREPKNGITDDTAWRLVKPFQKVSRARNIRYVVEDVRKMVDAAENDLADLLKGAYRTGARYGELADALVKHFDLKGGSLQVNAGKTNARTIVLETNALTFLADLTCNRSPNDFIFVRKNGERWNRSDQTRPVKAALKKAKLSDEGCIYALRHTYISYAIEGRVPLNIIAENCGTSVRMIEKTYAKILAESRRKFIEQGAVPTL
jgi:integrase